MNQISIGNMTDSCSVYNKKTKLNLESTTRCILRAPFVNCFGTCECTIPNLVQF